MYSFRQGGVKEKLVSLLFLAYPSLTLTVSGGMNGVFILALLLSILSLPFRGLHGGEVFNKADLRLYSMAMLGLLAATFSSQSYWQNYSAHEYDAISRYWLAIPIFFLFSSLSPYAFRILQYSFPIAAILGFIKSSTAYGAHGRSTSAVLDTIHFGDIELLLGFLSLLTINWFGRDNKFCILIKLCGFIAGIGASVASGSRGGWFAVPVLILLMLYFAKRQVSWKKLTALLLAIIATTVIMYSQQGLFKQRVDELLREVNISGAEVGTRDLDSSVGVRLQLYKAAISILLEHPFFGVGPSGFALEMKPMQEAGVITAQAAALGRGEVHNDILSKAAGMGLPGLIAILALYAVPLKLFWKASKSKHRAVRRTSILGIIFVSAIATFGLTVEFLNLTMAAAFYAFTVAVLLAACQVMHRGESGSKNNHRDFA